jgi:hypothetical protein
MLVQSVIYGTLAGLIAGAVLILAWLMGIDLGLLTIVYSSLSVGVMVLATLSFRARTINQELKQFERKWREVR